MKKEKDKNWGVEWPTRKYEIAYIDPPWDYDNRVQHGGTAVGYTSGAIAFYPTMTPEEIYEMRIADILEKNSLVYLWVTGPQFEIGIKAIKAWGLKYATIAFVWDKIMVNPGAYTMSEYEYVLVAKRGCIPKPRGARNVRQKVEEKRTGHSVKPIEVRRRIEQMHPTQSKVELFAEIGGTGWDLWGNRSRWE